MVVGEFPDRVSVGNIALPERAGFAASSLPDIDAAVAAVSSRRAEWQSLSVARRIELLDRMIADTYSIASVWVAAECGRKGISFDSPASGEEWGVGPWCVLSNMRQLRATLRDIERGGRPQLPGPVRSIEEGRVCARIFPREAYDRAMYTGVTGEVWMPIGVSAEELHATVGGMYRDGLHRDSRVGAILGAGNLSAIPLMDVIYKMFAENEVVVLKLNPITNHLRAVYSQAFGALIDGGYLRIVQGGAAEARYLVQHPAVDTVHLTGSDKTHDTIVFGTGDEAAARKADSRPLLTKPISSELGNVTPVIVVPGRWSQSAFHFHAQMLASALAQAGSFECVTPRVLVTPAGWSGRQKLLAALRGVLRQTTNRFAYYPGAEERFSLFTSAHPEAELLGAGAPGSLPWALIPGVDPAGEDIVFSTDPFAPVLAEAPLAASSVADFIDRAVSFCNDRLWGTLAAAVIAQPLSLRSREARAAFDRAISRLRYGTIVINGPTFYGFSLVSPPWGAFPGHQLSDIQSGRGVVHNTYLLARPEKTVLRAPFRTVPKPPWYVTHRRCHEVFSQLTAFEAAASPAKLPGIFWATMRG
jgi:acyl-CoA reductase-like NAD-dependent aldehyde dehydrogenase